MKETLDESVLLRHENGRTRSSRRLLLTHAVQGLLCLALLISLAPGLKVCAATSPQVEVTERMVMPRQGHTATVLRDGRVLIAGGRNELGILASAELYDPQSRTFTSIGSMTEARSGHAATLLPDGRVLISGGQNRDGLLRTVEIFQSQGQPSFRGVVSGMATGRLGHTASMLNNGQVLIAGGDSVGSAELFDVERELFLGQMALVQARRWHTATSLGEENVFLLGGGSRSGEYYSVKERQFRGWPFEMAEVRSGQVALAVEGGLLVLGGDEGSTAEEMSGEDGLFRTKLKLGGIFSSATLLANGNVLVLGPAMAQLFSPADGALESVEASLMLQRRGNTATELPGDKKVLVVGGVNKREELVAEGALYNPAVVRTEREEYASGSVVNVQGRGFRAGEEVELEMVRTDGKAYEGKNHWLALADGKGEIETYWQVCEGDCVGAVMALKVGGLSSGLKAKTGFRVTEASAESTQTKSSQAFRKTVSITAPSVTVSADTAANATSPSYTALGNIVINEASANDFSNTSGNKTIIISAPSGWVFLNTGISVSFTPNKDISSASISASSTTSFTVTFSATNTVNLDAMTISGVQVRASSGSNVPGTGNITRTGGTSTISGLTTGAVLGTVQQAAGAVTKLVVTLPGQTFTAGSGNSGTVTGQTAGTPFNITNIRAADQFFNIVTTYTGSKTLSYSGPGGIPSYTTSVSFSTGTNTTTLATTLTKKETTAITVSDGTVTGPASSSLTVGSGAFAKLQLLLPGESAAAGTATGKTGTPTTATAGTAFNVTVNAVDANWNVVTTAPTDTIHIASDDANATSPADNTLSSGTRSFSVTLKTAVATATRTLTASDVTDNTKTSNASPGFAVNAGTVTKLLILMPGEVASPGSATGKTAATPTAQTAGTAIASGIVVKAVDANWNVVSSAASQVTITTTDANATIADDNGGTTGNLTLASGTGTLSSFTFKTAGSKTITAAASGLTSYITPTITVNAGAAVKLQILLSGETASPGSATGKTGSPTGRTAGTAFASGITVNAVDANWNVVSSATPNVTITSSDTYATIADDNGGTTGNDTLVAGTGTLSSFTFKTAGTKTITATDAAGTLTANISANVTVSVGTAAKYLILLPGEVADPGSATGKTAATPTAQTAGTAIASGIVVQAVDANWNLVTTQTPRVTITCSDANAIIADDNSTSGGNMTLVSGTATLSSLTFKTAGTRTITATANSGTLTSYTTPNITVNAGAVTKLQILVPGETAAPGTTTGKTGSPTAQTAGTAIASGILVNAVDANWNAVSSSAAQVTITSTDANAAIADDNGGTSGNETLVSGTGTLSSFTFKTVGTWTITATASGLTSSASPNITVNVGAVAKLLVLLPGESASPGSATGKTGTPTAQTAGTAIASGIVVKAVDANWNVVSSSTPTVTITSADGNATIADDNGATSGNLTLASGTATLSSFTFKTAATQTITATATSGGLTAYTSANVTVNVGVVTKLQILVPGEVASPGSATGKTAATPTAQTAGTAITSGIVVRAVDANWNVVSSSVPTVTITSTDSNAAITDDNGGSAGNVTLVSGTATLSSLTFKTAGARTITATHTSGTLTANSSPTITVSAGAVAKLLILMPGEVASPGSATGKTAATPTAQTAGTAIVSGIVVKAVDANWNVVSSSTPNVTITSSDSNALIAEDNGATTGNLTLVSGAGTLSSFTFKTAGTPTVTAAASGLTSYTTPTITVNAGTVTKLQILVPGEVASPGSATGKTAATPTAQTAGTAIASGIVVRAVDANWNLVSSSTPTVTISSSTDTNSVAADDNGGTAGNVTLASGTATLSSFTFKTAGAAQTITATHTSGTLTAHTSQSITVNPGAFTKLQLLVPGETAVAGTSTGKSGTAGTRTTGTAFNVTVNAVDANWNLVSTAPANTIGILSSDVAATLPANAALSSGTRTFSLTFNTGGTATVTATNISDGTKTSSVSPTLTVTDAPNIITQPTSQTVCTGSSAIFSVSATGTGLTYQWRKAGSNISNGGHYSGATTATLTVSSAAAADEASYDVVVTGNASPAATSTSVTLTVTTTPAISVAPSNQAACIDSPVSFTVTASGGALSYQWQRNGVNLIDGGNVSGATTATLTLAEAALADTGAAYRVVVNNVCAAPATSAAATLTVNSPPSITDQPDNLTVCAGSSASFSVTATGTALTYQWRKDGSNISGATSSTLTINPAGTGDAGSYDVVVSGTCSPSATSVAVTLTVNTLPAITSQPSSQAVCTGSSASLSVTATGTAVTYQWRKAGVNISGATASTLTINPASTGDAGSYDVVVSGTCSPAVTSSAVTLTVNTPPAVTSQPSNQTICSGSSASFSVTATGAGLTYQWQKNGSNISDGGNISGATSATLTINPAGTGDAGSYNAVVSGTCSPEVSSSAATLTVNTAPSISSPPATQAICVGSTASFSVTATGTALTYQWRKDGSDISGATSATFTINAVATGDAGSYDVVLSGTCSPAATSAAATLTVNTPPTVTSQPSAQTVCEGDPTSFSVAGTGTGVTYRWQKGGVDLSDGGNISGATTTTLTINPVGAGDAGSYSAVVSGTCSPSVSSTSAALTVNLLPVVTVPPSNQTVCSGASASFSATATGTGLTYRWQKGGVDLNNGGNISGATSATLTVNPADTDDAGSYRVVVSGICNPAATSSAATLTISTPPSVTGQPSALTDCVGDSASFTVAVAGTGPFTYQWRKNGSAVSGATGSSYTIPSVSAGNAGVYDVVVSGFCGSPVTSDGATLTVNLLPSITTQPSTQAICSGLPATLSVVAAGTGPLTYQWRKNGANIAGATSASLSFAAVTLADAGSYDVVVSGVCSPSATSNPATLTIQTSPAITGQSGDQNVCAGASASFSVTATGTALTYQWRKNGSNISGATSSTYTIATVAAGHVGVYDVVVSGTCSPVVTSNGATLVVDPVASITTQPVSQAVCPGSSLNLNVVAAGVDPIYYQWRKGGVNLPGETNVNFVIAEAVASDAGSYDVMVTGGCGLPVTSSAAVLTILSAPAITTQPTSRTICVGTAVSFSVTATGPGLTYQWRKGGVNISGAVAATLAIPAPVSADDGVYDVVVAGTCGVTATSTGATLIVRTPPNISSQPTNTVVCAGLPATMTVSATGTALIYQWRKNGFSIPGATNSSYAITSVNSSHAGDYSVAVSGPCPPVLISSVANLTVNSAPSITTQPANQPACLNAGASFTVAATGSGLTYQWRKGGTAISGATNNSFTIESVTAEDVGTYDVVITGTCGSALTSVSRTLSLNSAVTITGQPVSRAACEGVLVNFSVTASGSGLTYQWRRNGSNLSNGRGVAGATASTLSISSAVGMEGAYDVVVQGSCGSPITSSEATLTVNTAPKITGQPANLLVCSTAPASFSVAATGSSLTYQWRKNGVNLSNGGVISGATSSTLAISAADVSHAGAYSVVVSGPCTPAATSGTANLVVTKPLGVTPAITGPTNVCAGQTARIFSIAAVSEAIAYDWTVPEDARIMSGQGKNSITVTWGLESGVVSVTPRNSCFAGATSSRAVEVSTLEVTQQPSDQTALTDCNLSVTFTTAVTGTPVPTVQWQVSTNAGRTWSPVLGKTNLTLTVTPLPVQDGSLYRAVFKSLCSSVISSNALLTIAKIPATTAVTATPDSQQYSDKVTVEASVGPASACTLVPATNVTFYIGTRKLGTMPLTVNGDVRKATLANVVVLEAPGEREIRAVFGGVSPYFQVDTATNHVTVTAEDARAVYTGPLTACANSLGNATIALKATVRDISGLAGDAAFDASAGVISNARVVFVNRDTETIIGEVPVVVGGSDAKVGTATLNWPVSLGTELSATYRVGMIVKNSYVENNPAADATITVSALVLTQEPVNQTALTDCDTNVTFTAAAAAIPAPTVQWQVSSTGGRTWSNLAGQTRATLTFAPVPSQNGYQYRAVFKNLCKTVTVTSSAATLTVNKIGTTSELTMTPDAQQYSDKVTVAATLTSASSCPLVAATNVTFYIGTRSLGTARLVDNGGVLKASLADVVVLEGPGTPAVRAVFTGVNPFFTVSHVTNSLTVNAEDARASYTGPATVVAAVTGKAVVSLKATVKDITAVNGDGAFDGNAGMIKNARVVFFNRDTDAVIGEVGVVAGTDAKVGTATLSWAVDIGAAASVTYNIGIRVKGYYIQEDSSADGVVTVRKP
jgi:hypothetical protein